jgi:hypothetical protein
MKALTLGTVITSMWQSPLIALLILIFFVFAVDLYNRYLESKKILCAPMPEFTTWSYADINTMARLHNLKPANRKKLTLIQLLQQV